MKNNIYIAGAWKNRLTIKHLMNDIENWGYKIIVDWTSHMASDNPKDNVEENIKGLLSSDCLLFCMDGIRSRGKYFELGYATALDKPVGIYLLSTYYDVNNSCGDKLSLPFDIIIENESIYIRSRMFPIMQTIDELKKWLEN